MSHGPTFQDAIDLLREMAQADDPLVRDEDGTVCVLCSMRAPYRSGYTTFPHADTCVLVRVTAFLAEVDRG